MSPQKKSSQSPRTLSAPSPQIFPLSILPAFWALVVAFIAYQKGRMLEASYWEEFVNLLLYLPKIITNGLGWNIILAAAMWVVFFNIGHIILRRLPLTGTTRIERILFSAGLGVGTLSLALLGLGLMGLWRPRFLGGCFLIGALLCLVTSLHLLWSQNKNGVKKDGAASPSIEHPYFWTYAATILIVCSAFLSLMATAGPEIFYDALIYHLALPRLYLLHGRIIPTPQNLYSGMPAGMEMLYGLSLALSNEHLAALLHCSFGWATAMALWTWLRRYSSNWSGIAGVLIFCLSPVIFYSGWRCGVDLGAAFYISLAFVAVSRALQTTDDRLSGILSAIAGIFIGFSLGVKYTVLPLSAAFLFIHFWIRRRSGKGSRDTIWLAACAAITFSPWLFKNALFYANPFYPFLHNFWGSAAPAHWKLFLADAHSRSLTQAFSSLLEWKSFFLSFWNICMGADSVDYLIGSAYLILIPTALFMNWGIFKKDSGPMPAWTTAAVLALAGYFTWYMSSTLVRFLIPTLPLMVCISILAVEKMKMPSWARHAVWFIVIWMCAINFQAIFHGGEPEILGTWDVLRGQQSQADYLKNIHVSYGQPYYAAMEYINQNLPRDSKILFLGESRAYYCERDFIAATVFDYNPFWVLARDAKSADELHAKLKSLGITHIFLNAFQLYLNSGYSAMMPRDVLSSPVFSEFWAQYLQEVFKKQDKNDSGQIKDWLVVYELRDIPNKNSNNAPENVPLFLLGLQRHGNG